MSTLRGQPEIVEKMFRRDLNFRVNLLERLVLEVNSRSGEAFHAAREKLRAAIKATKYVRVAGLKLCICYLSADEWDFWIEGSASLDPDIEKKLSDIRSTAIDAEIASLVRTNRENDHQILNLRAEKVRLGR